MGNLSFSTYYGGNKLDASFSIFVDQEENIFVGGLTSSTDLPTIGVQVNSSNDGFFDAYVAKFDPDGVIASSINFLK